MEEKRRPRCPGCELLRSQCVCAHIAPIDNRTPVRVLQHPNEARHALNTARWVVAGLRQARLISKPGFTFQDWCVPGHEPVLLYPVDADSNAQSPEHCAPGTCRTASSLVVIDGTWKQAGAILRAHPELLALRRIALPAHLGSAYRLRKSPRSDGLSTVEAVVAALDVLDAPISHAAVLRPFLAHIDQQIALQRARMGEQAFGRNYPDL